MDKKTKYLLGSVGMIIFSLICAKLAVNSDIKDWFNIFSTAMGTLGIITLGISMVEL